MSALVIAGLLCSGFADAANDDAGAKTPEPRFVALSVNGQVSAQAVVILRTDTGDWLLPVDAMRAANLRIPDSGTLSFNGSEYVPLSLLSPEDIRFDEARQLLELRLRVDRFNASSLNVRSRAAAAPATTDGAFLNYDILLDQGPIGMGKTLSAEGGLAVLGGVALSNYLFIDRPGLREAIRLDTSFTRDDLGNMTSLRLGDAITRPSPPLGRPFRFAGLQWGTNFQTRPELVTVPVATVSGQAALPSTVDLYVDNVLQSRNALPPGPFSVSSLPLVSGEGEVLVKVTDLSGQQQIFSQRFYSSASLLAAGLSDYSIELGRLRRNFGTTNDDYGDAFTSASWRHGVSDRLTIDAGVSLDQRKLGGLLGGIATSFPGFGIVSAAAAASQGPDGSGAQLALAYERRTKRHSFSARSQIASENYRQTGIDPAQTLRRLDTLFYGYRAGEFGSLGFSYTRQQRMTGDPISIATASVSTRQTAAGSLVLTLAQTKTGGQSDHSLGLFWVLSLGRDTSASAMHLQSSTAESQDLLQLQKNMPPGEGWGYRLQAARNAPNQASVFGQNAYSYARAEVAEFDGQTSVRAGLAGGIALLDGRWYASRRIDGSFGVVNLPGLANVRVYVDNQLVARTNVDGYALLPRLYPYMKNNVSIEQADLPLDAEIDSLRIQPVPAWRSGVRIEVLIRQGSAATLNLIRDDGTAVPAGATAILADGTADDQSPYVVGRDGLVYLSGLKSENHLRVQWPTGQCEATIPYVREPGSVPYLGQFSCARRAVQP